MEGGARLKEGEMVGVGGMQGGELEVENGCYESGDLMKVGTKLKGGGLEGGWVGALNWET